MTHQDHPEQETSAARTQFVRALKAFGLADQARPQLRAALLRLVSAELARTTKPTQGGLAIRQDFERDEWVRFAISILSEHHQFHEEAVRLLWEAIALVEEHERSLPSGTYLHKGTEYHALGTAMLRAGRFEEGLYNIQVAREQEALATPGGPARASASLTTLLHSMALPALALSEQVAKPYHARCVCPHHAQTLLDSLDTESLGMLVAPLWLAQHSWDAASLGRMRRMNALAGLTLFLEAQLRKAANAAHSRHLGTPAPANMAMGRLLCLLGQQTRRPWHPIIQSALDPRNPHKAQVGATTASGATRALSTIRRATSAGRGRFAARAYLTALLLRNFSHHTLEHRWKHLDDGRWRRLLGWACAAVLQCYADFRSYLA